MNCREVRESLVAYLDDEVTPAERAQMQEHLAGCAACQQAFSQAWQLESRVRRALRAAAAQAEAPAGAWADLQARLAVQPHAASALNPGLIVRKLARRPLAATALALLVLAASVVGLAPPVRAQVVETVSAWLRFPMAGSHSGVVVSAEIVPFRPLAPTYLPEGYHNSYMLSGGAPGEEALELRAFSADRFVIIFEHHTGGERSLPAGQAVSVSGQPAVLLTGLQGTANVLAPEPQPDHAALFASGSGGGGGGGTDPRDSLPDTITYDDGVRVTWYVGDTLVEILSNETPDETLKIAGSMDFVEVVEDSLPLSVPPAAEAPDLPGAPDPAAAPAGETYVLQFPNDGNEWPVSGLPFRPYGPTYLPFDIVGGGGGGGGQELTLVFTDMQSFVRLTERPASAAGPPPEGETVTVSGEAAVLVTGLAGSFETAPQQPAITYGDGVELTWQVGEVQITLLSNLPVEEALKVAESMVPATTGPAPTLPPGSGDGGGGGGSAP